MGRLLLAAALVAGAAQGQEAPGGPEELLDALLAGLAGFRELSEAELQQEIAEVGGVPFREPVAVDFMDRDGLGRYLRELFDAEYPPERAAAEARTLAAFDLLPPSTDLRAERERLLLDNVVGFYDERPGRRRLYAVSAERRLTPANQMVLAHELRHALQDQYMGVHDLLDDAVSDYDDRSLALLSLLEGDATFVMERFLLKRLPGGEEALSGLSEGFFGLGAMGAAAVPGAPPVVRDQLVLPYFAGRDFVRALFKQGGWEAVKAAWSRPPASTEQVLHPEKYRSLEAPRPVAVAPTPPGAHLLREGVLGEALLRTFLGEGNEAAAAGWGGDAYRCLDVGGRTLLLWRSEWDSPAEAEEFLAAARRRLGALGPGREREGWEVFARGEWRFALGRRRGGVELVSSDAPGTFDAALRAAGRAEGF